jgi:NADPH-dependent 2,4-dienoyl-CoA reductase/sulfur reductase-like enzyme
LVCEEPQLPYERPPLTKALLREQCDVDDLQLEAPSWFIEHGVETSLGVPAVAFDPESGRVKLADGRDLQADKIVLATGSEPVRADLEGVAHPRVIAIRRLADSMLVRQLAQEGSALVLGGGFIACEAAASLALRGTKVTLIDREALPQTERIGERAAARIAGWLTELGVEHVGGARVTGIHDGRIAQLADGRVFKGACTVLATGVRPRGELAEAAGLPSEAGAVLVDERMQVEGFDGRVLAVGDVALAFNAAAGRRIKVEHWGDALAQGEVAGRVLCGASARWAQVPGFWTTIGERTLKFAGWGDGFDEVRFDEDAREGFTAWYTRGAVTVAVLTHERDADYESGRSRIANADPPP